MIASSLAFSVPTIEQMVSDGPYIPLLNPLTKLSCSACSALRGRRFQSVAYIFKRVPVAATRPNRASKLAVRPFAAVS